MKFALLVTALLSSAAIAQENSEASVDGSAVMAQMTQQLSAPEPAPILPVTLEKMRIVRQYLDEGNMKQGMQAAVEISYTRLKAQMLSATKGLTDSQRVLFVHALTRAFNDAMATRLKRTYDSMETYYARRMTTDELQTVADYYATGIGYKSQHVFAAMTPAERQQNGLSAVEHPALMKFTKAGLGYTASAPARRKIEDPLFNADFTSRFCGNLTAEHLSLSSCPSAVRITRR